jgi:hypothetical protein
VWLFTCTSVGGVLAWHRNLGSEIPHSFRFEFDPANEILLSRLAGRITDELLGEFYQEARKRATVTDARVSIVELSAVSEFAVSSDYVRFRAKQLAILPDPRRRRFIVVQRTVGLGLARMFQIAGEPSHAPVQTVQTLDEVWAATGIQSPHFEDLE